MLEHNQAIIITVTECPASTDCGCYYPDMTDLLNLAEMLSSDECAEVIKFMAASYREDRFKREHINYLFLTTEKPGSGVAQTLSCDLRKISWKLLLESNNLECDTIQVIVFLGGLPTPSDIRCLVEHSEDVSILEVIVKNCSPRPSDKVADNLFKQAVEQRKFTFSEYIAGHFPSVANGDLNKLIMKIIKQKDFKFMEEILGNLQNIGDINHLIDYSLKHQKFSLILHLISHGVEISVARIVKEMQWAHIPSNNEIVSYLKSTTEGHTELFVKAVKCSQYTFAESLLVGNRSAIPKISLSSVLNKCPIPRCHVAKERHISFIKKLLDIGMDPNGVEGEKCPLDIILDLSKDHQMEQIQLLIVLLQCGAAIERCTYQRKNQTTLLHIATKLAVDSGIFLHACIATWLLDC